MQDVSAGESLAVPRPAPGRPPEIEEFLNSRLVHPLSRRLAVALVPTGITPNAVSAAGAGMTVAAGLAYILPPWPGSVVLGFALHAGWHVVDGADGELARRTGKSSPLGEIVDGLCDYGGHIVVYIMLAAFLAQSLGLWAWALATASGVSRIVQANHYESARRTYLWRAYGVPWVKRAGPEAAKPGGGPFDALAVGLARAYVALSSAVSPDPGKIDATLAALAARPTALAAARNHCRQAEQGPVKRLSWLSANKRTVALGVSMALGGPFWFFLFESTVLNAVLVWSIMAQGRLNRRLASEFDKLDLAAAQH